MVDRCFNLCGFTSDSTYSNGASYDAAVAREVPTPKSMIHTEPGRLARSTPLKYGRSTSPFGLPLGFGGSSIHRRAVSSSISKGPAGVTPMKEIPTFSRSLLAWVTSVISVRFAFIVETVRPSSTRSVSAPDQNPPSRRGQWHRPRPSHDRTVPRKCRLSL